MDIGISDRSRAIGHVEFTQDEVSSLAIWTDISSFDNWSSNAASKRIKSKTPMIFRPFESCFSVELAVKFIRDRFSTDQTADSECPTPFPKDM
jgi:hypothetical protein